MVVMIIGDGGDINIVIFCETIWMLSSWCNCLSLFVFNLRFHVLFTCETMWMMSPLTKPRPASLQGMYLSSWTKWNIFNFDKNLNINLNLCMKNTVHHGQNEILSCEASERMDSSYKGIVVKESFQANATLTKRWFPCNFDQNDG